MFSLISCANCWFNPLQAGSLGTPFGYCVRHRFVLRHPDETTCTLHTRKDLLLPSAQSESARHALIFGPEPTLKIVRTREVADPEIHMADLSGVVNGDRVVNLVAEYGDLNTKVESLSRLRDAPGPRAELAMLSLARAYTANCVARKGSWTSGLHFVWWTRERLELQPAPQVNLEALRFQMPVSLQRQIELVRWSLAILRLSFVSDIGYHAQLTGDPVAALASLAEDAAVATGTVSLKKLITWIRRTALPRFDEVLGFPRYKALANELHQDRD